MPTMPPTFRPRGLSSAEAERQYDRERGSSTERLYDGRWARAAKAHLREQPLCVYCDLDGRITQATLVDHFWPHRGDSALFWRREFWCSSCAACHSGMKQSVERQGVSALTALAARLGLPPVSAAPGLAADDAPGRLRLRQS